MGMSRYPFVFRFDPYIRTGYLTGMKFHVRTLGIVTGPFDAAEIGRRIAARRIGAADLVRAEGSDDWQPVTRIFPSAFQAVQQAKEAAATRWAWAVGIVVALLWLWGRDIEKEKQREAGELAKHGTRVVSEMDAYNASPQRNKWDRERIESDASRFEEKSKAFFDKYGKPK
jgi:hypothetical protein